MLGNLHQYGPLLRNEFDVGVYPKALICAPTILTGSTIFALFFAPIWLMWDLWNACALTLGLLIGNFG